jgi:serine/threonine-protein kinase HipA
MTSRDSTPSRGTPDNVDPRTGELLRLYVWVWLPGQTEPVPAGVLTRTDRVLSDAAVVTFTYGRTYLQRRDAIPLFAAELPLAAGTFDPSRPGELTGALAGRSAFGRTFASRPRQPLPLHGCIRDAGPDAWGRRVINLRLASDPNQYLSELTYLRSSGSDRIGALDFQDSAQQYVPRGEGATLEQLLDAAERIDAGEPLPPDLHAAAGRGTSIGGARPKALLTDESGRSLIAKFPSSTDTRPVVKAEAVSMLLAGHAGLDVSRVEVRTVDKRDVLLVERFDRGSDGTRRALVSGLTILGEHEMGARHASYADLAESIRVGPWTDAGKTLAEMYRRLVFNVCVGNTDDHLRNHAAFWDGSHLTLTPAYDLEPVARCGREANHAIALTRDGRRDSRLATALAAAAEFHLTERAARAVIDDVVDAIHRHWDEACDQARLTGAEREGLWQREILNDYVFEGYAAHS